MTDSPESGLTKANFAARYSVLRLLGSGAHGRVFLARQNALNRLVAIKFFVPRGADRLREDAARFLRETRLLGRLSHPSIVPVFDANLLGKSLFLVIEYLDGGDLSRRLVPGQPLAPSEAVRISLAVAEGLEYLHAEDVVHRDLKPENILLGTDGAVKVTDFGLARNLELEQSVTGKGALLGTPAYLAPETIRSGQSTAASDIYAFGVLLFECFDGRYPYDVGEAVSELLTRKVELDALPPGPSVPAALAPLVSACLARDPVRRPSATKLREALAAMSRDDAVSSAVLPAASVRRPRAATTQLGVPAVPAPSSRRSRKHRWRRAWAVTLSCLALLVCVAALSRSGGFSRSASTSRQGPWRVTTASSPPSTPAPVTRVGEALLQQLCDAVHPAELQWQLRAAVSPEAVLQRFQAKGVRPVVQALLQAGGGLPMEGIREDVLTKAVESIQTLRLAAGRFWAAGLELPADYSRLAERSFPLIKGVPAGATRVLDIGKGLPAEVPVELAVLLGASDLEMPLLVPASVHSEWALRRPRRLWWVLQIRDLNVRCVLDFWVETLHGTARLPFLPVRGPVTDPDDRYSGSLAMGFDWRLFSRVTGPVKVTYSILGGKLSAGAPTLEKLELWQELGPEASPPAGINRSR